MGKKVCVATGCFYKLECSDDYKIDLIKDLDVDGLEITFASAEEVKKFSLSEESEAYVKSLSWNSVHAPFKYTFDKSKKSEKIIKLMENIYSKTCSKNLVVHPDRIDDFSRILGRGMSVSTENLIRYETNKLEDLLKNHKNLGIVLDLTHAACNSLDEIEKLYGLFHDKITEIHCSAHTDGKRHQLFHKATEEYLAKSSIVKSLDVPLVIELELPEDVTVSVVREEVEFLKKWYFS
ncbi:hypothetical protein FJZ53_06190 [Candidatus Woesearchaeota archaeon]|nr:hypothetical protein [Candidatus Woesearchaeota archaeon]